MREAVKKGWADYTPIKLSDIPRIFYSGRKHIDVALIQVSPPDENGQVSLGIDVDINYSAINVADKVIVQINPQMPRTSGESLIDFSKIDHWVYSDEPLIEYIYGKPDEISQEIGKFVSHLVENGSTIQVGIGQIPNAVIRVLVNKKDLSIFTEVFSDGVIDLVKSGAIHINDLRTGAAKITTSFVMGSKKLYNWVGKNSFVKFRPTEYVNNIMNIAKNKKQVSINTALSIDLTGQVNSDSIGHQFYSGIGGQVDFVRGAALSEGGKPIICLPSTTSDGKKSRIVSVLEKGAGVVVSRGDVNYVITEYGYAFLHGRTIRERALQLIGIAHPKFRKKLLKEAKMLNYLYKDQRLPQNEEGIIIMYPELYESEYITPDGQTIYFRPIKFTDERMLQDLYYELTPRDRKMRFFAPLKTFSHKLIQTRVIIDYETKMGIVGFLGEEPNQKIIATGAYYLDREGNENLAEISLTIHEKYRKMGLARHLLQNILIKIAKEKGISGFKGDVLYNNKGMLHILNTIPYKIHFMNAFGGEMSFIIKFSEKK